MFTPCCVATSDTCKAVSRDVVIDTGLGVTSLKAAAPDLFTNDTLAIATHAHTDHIGNFHEFAHRAIHHAEADVVATITGTLEFDISDTDEETFVQLAGWGYDIRDGLLTAIPDAGFLLDGHPTSSCPSNTTAQ